MQPYIAIHSTAHDPAVGGLRMWPYSPTHRAADRLAEPRTEAIRAVRRL